MFRRRAAAQAPEADQAAAGAPQEDAAPARPSVTAGKGRPTPKRSEAERRRRPYSAPANRKAANQEYRDRQKGERARRYAAMQRGEEWAMPAKDRGPARALARDYVDSKRRFSEYYMYGLIVLMILVFVRNPLVQTLVPGIVVIIVLIMVGEGIFLGRKVRSMVTERYPGEPTRGLAMYSAMRAIQIRRLRMPKPRVKPGDAI
ncbi:MAG: DUF3043 domain-containing protein [Actinobacteria bacterium]|nr:DUF3043 domain-containing protein [Actinomycetota bacterium]MBO0784919.1 DUF3043 domain-containing protein [Actinomycetota bacterium]